MALWTPADYGSPVKHWYDVNDTATLTDVGGGVISDWADKSGNAFNLTQATSGKRGTRTASNANFNNKPTISFPLNGGMTSSTQASLGSPNLLMDSSKIQFNGYYIPFTTPQNAVVAARFPSTGITTATQVYNVNGSDVTTTQDDGLTDPTIAFTVFWAGRVKSDGQSTTVGRFFDATGTFTIANRASDWARTQDADVAELILVSGALNDADRDTFVGYLAWKWGLQGSLPAGHPYKNAAPTNGVDLSGVSATGAGGTLAPSTSRSLSGVSGSFAVGALSAAVSSGLTGIPATSATAPLTPSISVALSGVAATAQQGSLSAGAPVSQALTGQQAAGQVGSLAFETAVRLTGLQASGQTGSLAKTAALTILGQQITGSLGAPVPTLSRALSGVSATGQRGTLTAGQPTIVALTGVAATAALGALGHTTSIGLSMPAMIALLGSLDVLRGGLGAPQFVPISTVPNTDLLRRKLNAILEILWNAAPGYGPSLPDVSDQPDGRLFVLTNNTIHQVQNGAWRQIV